MSPRLFAAVVSQLWVGAEWHQDLNTGTLVYNLFRWSLAELILQNDFQSFNSHISNPGPFAQKMKVLQSHQL